MAAAAELRGSAPNLMFVTPAWKGAPGGRELLSHLHYNCLKEILGEHLVLHELPPVEVASWRDRLRALVGYIDGVTPEMEEAMIAKAKAEGVSQIFFNGSNLGRLVRAAHKRLPNVELFTFFHNVEARFFLGSLRNSPSVPALAVLIANFVAERMAVRFSERRVVLSERDAQLLARIYGRGGTDILPMALEDKLPQEQDDEASYNSEPYALFVGGAFYANKAGISWFSEEVAPHIQLKTYVVGRGLEDARAALEGSGNVEVVGAVDRLDRWYSNAKVVIAPIFDGSGMKTKVAEAWMFGKRVVGTSEAFSGYDLNREAGWLCENQRDFIDTLRSVDAMVLPRFDVSLRALYERNYSRAATLRRLTSMIGRTSAQSKESHTC